MEDVRELKPFSAYGATRIAELVIEGMKGLGLPICDYLLEKKF
ncbi:hypothetical protein OH784_29140 [Ectobacillus funiculus]